MQRRKYNDEAVITFVRRKNVEMVTEIIKQGTIEDLQFLLENLAPRCESSEKWIYSVLRSYLNKNLETGLKVQYIENVLKSLTPEERKQVQQELKDNELNFSLEKYNKKLFNSN